MNDSANSHHSAANKPNPASWLVAALSLVFWGFIAFQIIVTSDTIIRRTALEHLKTSLAVSDVPNTRKYLSESLSREGLNKLLDVSLTGNRRSGESYARPLLSLVDVMRMAQRSEFSGAAATLRTIESALSYNLAEDRLGEFDNLIRQISQNIEEGKALKQQETELLRSKDEQEKSAKELISRFPVVVRDFAYLLGLEAPHEVTQISVYQEGVLKGLPVVAGIRDGIAELTELGGELQKLGAVVKSGESQNAHQVFTESLEDLRDRTFPFAMESEAIRSKKEEIEESLRKIQGNLAEIHTGVKNDVSKLILLQIEATFTGDSIITA